MKSVTRLKTFLISLVCAMAVFAGCAQDSKHTVNRGINNQPIKSGPIVYVALGDSTGVGVGATGGGYVSRMFKRVLESRPGSTLVNLCISGATTFDVIRAQLDRGAAAKPQLVTLGIGINDIGHGVDVDQFSRNYELILDKLRKETEATIVITNIPDISSAPQIPAGIRTQYQQEIIQFNQRLGEVAQRYGAEVFDIYAITKDELSNHPEYFSSDGFHPSDKGYELWANEMWPSLERVLSGR